MVVECVGPEFRRCWTRGLDQTLELAKKEGRVVVSITTSAELRAAIEKHFEKRFGVDVEPVVGRAPNVIRKTIEESKGSMRYVDVHVDTKWLRELASSLLKISRPSISITSGKTNPRIGSIVCVSPPRHQRGSHWIRDMTRSKTRLSLSLLILALLFLNGPVVLAQSVQSKSAEWERTVDSARKEGKVVVSVPTSAELRKELEAGFQKKFPGIELELSVARGASNINKIAEEQNAGVRNIDLHIGGTTSIVTGLLAPNLLEPILPSMLLPEVSDPKNWWGGHIWVDNAKKYIYSFTAYMTETVWFNTTLVSPGEIVSWDSLLDPKWKGRIAILDPRSSGSGESTWAFLLKIKGEPFLTKLAAQDMIVGRNLRQLGEAVARGKAAISIGLSYYTYLPFIKAELPVRSLSNIKEGYYAATGSGNLAILKNVPHPNASRVFVNWLLSKEGQAAFTKAMGQPTRRFDVDTQWTREFGHVAAKEALTLEKFYELENGSEEVVNKFRKPAMMSAEKLFQ